MQILPRYFLSFSGLMGSWPGDVPIRITWQAGFSRQTGWTLECFISCKLESYENEVYKEN